MFSTDFKEMDAAIGWDRTTNGIWLARCPGIEPGMLVMDLEGTGGKKRGKDDAFEKKSALFALSLSNVVLINTRCHDIGCAHSSNMPLLETVIEVMMQLQAFHKTTLIFVIRDKAAKTSPETLDHQLRQDLEMMWTRLPKAPAYENQQLSEIFKVIIFALPKYEDDPSEENCKNCNEKFEREVARLRKCILQSTPSHEGYEAVFHASELCSGAKSIWETINANDNPNLLSLQEVMAKVYCAAIKDEEFHTFEIGEDWIELEKATTSSFPERFGERLTEILRACLNRYDDRTKNFDQGVRDTTRRDLEQKLVLYVHPAYSTALRNMLSETLEAFQKAFDKAMNEGEFPATHKSCCQPYIGLFEKRLAVAKVQQADWDTSGIQNEFLKDMEAHIKASLKEKLRRALEGPVIEALEYGVKDAWANIRELLLEETQSIASVLPLELLHLEKQQRDNILAQIETSAKDFIQTVTERESGKVLQRMIARFSALFTTEYKYGDWKREGTRGIRRIADKIQTQSLELLCLMVAVRLEDYEDVVEKTLISCLGDNANIKNILDQSTWNGIPSSRILIFPRDCQTILEKFLQEVEDNVDAFNKLWEEDQEKGDGRNLLMASITTKDGEAFLVVLKVVGIIAVAAAATIAVVYLGPAAIAAIGKGVAIINSAVLSSAGLKLLFTVTGGICLA